jgi:hypothetical protein
MALLYGHAGRLTAKNGGFRPGQAKGAGDKPTMSGKLSFKEFAKFGAPPPPPVVQQRLYSRAGNRRFWL